MVSEISHGARGTLVEDQVTTVEVAESPARARVVTITNDDAAGRISVAHGLRGAVADPVADADHRIVGPGESRSWEIAGAGYDFLMISATACVYRVDVAERLQL